MFAELSSSFSMTSSHHAVQALSTMHCDCGTRHRRYAVASRTQSAARYCQRCEDRHPAKDNDIWAETRMFGFLWYYYVCVGGVVYDITEWAGCSVRAPHC
jgi:DnaJ family protein C protein 14